MFPTAFKTGFSMVLFGVVLALLEINLFDYIQFIIIGTFSVCVLTIITCIVRKNKILIPYIVGALILCVVYFIRLDFSYKPMMNLYEKYRASGSPKIECVVESVDKSASNFYSVTAKIVSVEGERLPLSRAIHPLRILISSNKFEYEVGDKISFITKLTIPGGEKVDITRFYRSKGVFLAARVYDGVTLCEKHDDRLLWFISLMREKIKDTIYSYLPDDYAGVSLGMLTGEKEGLSDEHKEVLQRTGIIHLFSVSGFHVALWGFLVNKAFLRLGFNMRGSATLTILFTLFFAVLTGMSKGTLRAALTLSIFFLGRIVKRDSDGLASLGVASIIILILEPFSVSSLSFLLSFFATFGIITSSKYFKKFGSVISVSISALLFTMPITFVFGGTVSLLAPFTNFLCGSVAEFSVLLTGTAVVLSFIPVISSISNGLFLIVGLADKYMILISEKLSKLTFLYFESENIAFSFTLASFFAFLSLSLLIPEWNDRRTKMAKYVGLAMFSITYLFVIFS